MRRHHWAARRYTSQLFWSYVLITSVTLAIAFGYVTRLLIQQDAARVERDLLARAAVVANDLAAFKASPTPADIQARTRLAGELTGARVTVIGVDGIVLGDSQASPTAMDDHSGRPEVMEAHRSGTGVSRRFSRTMNQEMLYVAVTSPDRTGNVIRLSLPVTPLDAARAQVQRDFAVTAAILALVCAAVSLLVSRRFTRPLLEARAGAARFAAGDLNFRMPVPEQEEVGHLVRTLNEMAGSLASRIREIQNRQEEEAVILSSMVEGLVAVDCDERVLKINRAAHRLIRDGVTDVEGRTMQEVFRYADLQRYISRVLKSASPLTDELALPDGRETVLRAHGSTLRNADGEVLGAVAVFHDITRVRSLEQVRTQFVANVSHELKTPVTSIRGFVETLQDGAVDDPSEARRFLNIIARQTDRLYAIIEDLLTLSRLEEEAGRGEIVLQSTPLRPILDAAVQLCERTAREHDLSVDVDCPDDLVASVNPPLLEQAVVNLLDNAVKHGGDGRAIRIRARRDNGVEISVEDQGEGIAREHQERIFERFYRVDQSRSRSRGGTGLGLSIVKHIAQAHGGTASVVSRPGHGATFSITLPPDSEEGTDGLPPAVGSPA